MVKFGSADAIFKLFCAGVGLYVYGPRTF